MNWKLSLCAAALPARPSRPCGTTTLRFGIEAAYPPFESKTPAGQLQGFDVDIGNAVCAKLNMKCVWVENAFDGLIPAAGTQVRRDQLGDEHHVEAPAEHRLHAGDLRGADRDDRQARLAAAADVASLRGKHVGVRESRRRRIS